eukprot:scaffold51978_cov53-Attheya_sp.AAC.2
MAWRVSMKYTVGLLILALGKRLTTEAFLVSSPFEIRLGSISVNSEKKGVPTWLFNQSKGSQDNQSVEDGVSSRRGVLGSAAAAVVAVWGYKPLDGNAATVSTPGLVSTSQLASKYLCDPSVSSWKNKRSGRIVHLIGTAHISSDSALLAGNVVRETRPEAVFVELDRKRVGRALPPDASDKELPSVSVQEGAMQQSSPKQLTSVSVQEVAMQQSTPTRQPGPLNVKERVLKLQTEVVGGSIKGLYKRLEGAGFNAGEEFVVAVREGLMVGSQIVLGDQDVDVTLRRLTLALGKTDLKKLLSPDGELEERMKLAMPETTNNNVVDMNSNIDKEQMTQYVETLKGKENVKQVMGLLKEVAPELYKAMVSERDEYMANGLNSLDQFPSIVAVMGIAHIDGVEQNLLNNGWEPFPVPCRR